MPPLVADVDPGLFASMECPLITIQDYVERIAKYAKVDDATLVHGAVYFARLRRRCVIDELQMHRAIAAVLVCARKYVCDRPISMRVMARVTGVTVQELCRLEKCLLHGIQWDLFVSREEYDDVVHATQVLARKTAGRLSCQSPLPPIDALC